MLSTPAVFNRRVQGAAGWGRTQKGNREMGETDNNTRSNRNSSRAAAVAAAAAAAVAAAAAEWWLRCRGPIVPFRSDIWAVALG